MSTLTLVWLLLAGAILLFAVVVGLVVYALRDGVAARPAGTSVTRAPLTTETAPKRARPTEPIRTDNSLAWVLVALPLVGPVLIAGAYLAKTNASSTVVLVVTLAVTVVLVLLDERLLRRQQVEVSGWWAAFLVPFYLIDRSRITGQTFALPAAWVLAAAVGVTAGIAVDRTLGPVDMTESGVELAIGLGLHETGDAIPKVKCTLPGTVWVHDSFTCTTTIGGSPTLLEVTVLDHDGRFNYREQT